MPEPKPLKWRRVPYKPGPVHLVTPHPSTDPFANHDTELVAGWIKERYGLDVVLVRRATPTYFWVRWPFYGWGAADGVN